VDWLLFALLSPGIIGSGAGGKERTKLFSTDFKVIFRTPSSFDSDSAQNEKTEKFRRLCKTGFLSWKNPTLKAPNLWSSIDALIVDQEASVIATCQRSKNAAPRAEILVRQRPHQDMSLVTSGAVGLWRTWYFCEHSLFSLYSRIRLSLLHEDYAIAWFIRGRQRQICANGSIRNTGDIRICSGIIFKRKKKGSQGEI
jgi:hypothetical protein